MSDKINPLIFGPRSIRAWQAHAKSQTRRLVHPQPEQGGKLYYDEVRNIWRIRRRAYPGVEVLPRKVRQPYAVGEICWIREGLIRTEDDLAAYQVDWLLAMNQGRPMTWRWKHDKLAAMFMPRRACRYHARIASVRPEWLQDISNEDAIAEGTLVDIKVRDELFQMPSMESPREHYADWWATLHHKVGTRSADNPLAWVYSIEDCEGGHE